MVLEHNSVRIFWDANETLLEKKDGGNNLVTFPFTEYHLQGIKSLIDVGSDQVDKILWAYHDVIDPNAYRVNDRAMLPNFARWRFLGSKNKGGIGLHALAICETLLDGGNGYRKYVHPYHVIPGGVVALQESHDNGFENTIVSGMPWTVRDFLMLKIRRLMPFISKQNGILLNPDLENVSGAHLKPASWLLSSAGVLNGVKEMPVVIDDDDYILKLAEHLGFLAISTIGENAAKDQKHKAGVRVFPGRRNSNGQVLYGKNVEEISELVRKWAA